MKARFGILCCGLVTFAGLGAGCRMQSRLHISPHTGGSAFLFNQFQAFDGKSKRPMRFEQVVKRCRDADVVLFGEEHGNAVCNQLEAQLLLALINTSRPCALAMEFFENDIQSTLDAYLAGRLDGPEFRKLTKRRSSYLETHRPLIELCRAGHVPVIAANAPRRLVRAYRKSGKAYEDYRTSVPAEDRRWLPATNEYLAGAYQDRFAEIMKRLHEASPPASRPSTLPATQSRSQPTTPPASHPASSPTSQAAALSASQPVTRPASGAASAPTTQLTSAPATQPASAPALPTWQELYAAQLLWDQAMSEAIAQHRALHRRELIMLIVGKFHVSHAGGVRQKFLNQRPADRVLTVVYSSTPETSFAFDETDYEAGDIIIYGVTPPEPPKKMPAMPGKKPMTPSSQPVSAAATQPASAPVTPPTTAPGE